MRDVRLGVSWLDGQAFSGWWEPLSDANEFHLLSCYVSEEGWSALRTILDARPKMQATMVFSLSGIERGRAEHAALGLFEYIERTAPRVRGYLIADAGRLFHPKAHASRSRGHTRTVVGSANLTSGGLSSNHEMISVIDDDHVVYDQFVKAVNALRDEAHTIMVNEMTREGLRRWLQSRPVRSTVSGSDAPARREEQQWLFPNLDRDARPPLPPAVDKPLIDTPVDGEALGAVERLLHLGGRLYYVNSLDDLTVTVSLEKFKSADIVETSAPKPITDGLSVQQHSALAVSLVPDGLRGQLKDLNKALGQLKGRFAIETAGLPWVPADWQERFFAHWKAVVNNHGLEPLQIEAQVGSHLRRLRRELRRGDARLLVSLRDAIRLRPVSAWNQKAAARLLGEGAGEEQALDTIVKHVRETVEKHLQEDFVLAQLLNVRQRPRFRSCRHEHIDALDALHILADWTLASIGSIVRVGAKEARPPTNGVAQALCNRLGKHSEEWIDIYKTALEWRRKASESMEDPATLLDSAWAQFSRWFGLHGANLESWLGDPPSWSGGRP